MDFPPSPATSVCDSLDGIEDLDAFLALQGPISGLPTPPMDRSAVTFDETATEEAEDIADRRRVTALFAGCVGDLTRASYGTPPHVDVKRIQHIIDLARRRTSREVCVVAYNILCELRDLAELKSNSPITLPADTLIICAMQLASDFLDDRPISNHYWNEGASGVWPNDSMQSSKLNMLFAIDWRLHALSTLERIEHTMSVFLGDTALSPDWNACVV
ncbi:uncharacterized protein RCC_09530 [Ramularia collo-cygni]|uniref:Uncharacterized protein n=1 Tax=Ramularia collo-cygni TaxID=112498 RepID=A0A2D3V371_9PEZI|nr:uncharacterized protein RCC_09530 [Ramularia collo-cygni]CZT23816.1 uncharacterized protein RCC_09530 [Ramularia collo-cygni]